MAKYIVKATCELDEAEAVTFYEAAVNGGGRCLVPLADRAIRYGTQRAAEASADGWAFSMSQKYADRNAYTFEVEAV